MRFLFLFLLLISCYNQPKTICTSKNIELICLFDSLNVSIWDNTNIEDSNNLNIEKKNKKTKILNSLIDKLDSIPNSKIKINNLMISYHRIEDKGFLISRNSLKEDIDSLLVYKKIYIDQHVEGKIFKIKEDTIHVKDFYIYDTEYSVTNHCKWFINIDGKFIEK